MPGSSVSIALTCLALVITAAATAQSEDEPRSAEALLDACERAEHGQPQRAIELAWQAEERIDPAGQPRLMIRVEGCRGWALASLGQHGEARAAASRILELAGQAGAAEFRIGALRRASAILQRAEAPNRSIALLEQALELARQHTRDDQLPDLYVALGVAHSEATNHDQAIAHYETALRLAEQQGNDALQLPIRYNLGLTLRGAGRLEAARDVLSGLREPLQAPGLEIRLASLYAVLGSIERELGNPVQARSWLDRSEALHRQLDNPAEHTALLVDRARLELEQDQPELAERYARQALEEARRADYYFSLRGALRVAVDVLERLGRHAEALELQREYTERTERYLREQQESRLAGIEAQLGLERQARELAEARRRALELERRQTRQNTALAVAAGLLVAALGAFVWQRAHSRRLAQLSRTDLLTGLPNRRAITALFERRTGGIGPDEGVLMLLDLDRFKSINDSYGHDTGDRALREVAASLQRFANAAGGHIGRWGGEEFLLVLPADGPERAASLAREVIRCVREIRFVCPRRGPIALTASAGFAPLDAARRDSGQERWEPAFLIADRLLYRAKAGGRDTWLGAWPTHDGGPLEPHRIDEQIDSGRCRLLGAVGHDGPSSGH